MATHPQKNTKHQPQQKQAKAKAQAAGRANRSNAFLDMGYDVLHKIMSLCLKADTPIEFCPEPFAFEVGWNQKFGPARHAREIAQIYQRGEVLHTIGPYNGLLRTCRALHNVAADVLYGTNDFRFTNNAGVMGLEQFLFHIDKYHIHRHGKRLRNITVLHPSFMTLPTTLTNADTFLDGIAFFSQIREYDPAKPQFSLRARWFEHWQGDRGWKWLSQIDKLVHLRFVIPRGLQSSDLIGLENAAPDIKNLQVTILRKNATQAGEHPFPDLEMREQGQGRYMLDATDDDVSAYQFARAHNKEHSTKWKYDEVFIDGHGNYVYDRLAELLEAAKESDKTETTGANDDGSAVKDGESVENAGGAA